MWAQSARDVGKIIAIARRSQGLSQVELAKATGTTQAWISAVERGKETAQLGRVLRLLSHLQVRLAVVEAPWLTRSDDAASETGISLSDILNERPNSDRSKR